MVRCAQVELKELVANTLDQHVAPSRTEMQRILQDTGYLGTANPSINLFCLLFLAERESRKMNNGCCYLLQFLMYRLHRLQQGC